MNWNSRTQLLVGEEGVRKLADSHVLVVGLGGVGAYAAEQLARAGIGKMTIIDCDTVNVTNKNRYGQTKLKDFFNLTIPYL